MAATRVRCAVVGGGAVGAAIAYRLAELGQEVTLFEAARPGEMASGAALGVLLAAGSTKRTGEAVALRLAGLSLWDRWLPEIERRSGMRVPYNRQGVWRLYGTPPTLAEWQKIEGAIAQRRQEGWDLRWVSGAELARALPGWQGVGALYSGGDRQVAPRPLIRALLGAARSLGARIEIHRPVANLTELENFERVVVAAGLGSAALLGVPLQAVGGQALRVHCPDASLASVVRLDEDINVVPLPDREFWVGATVEFPPVVLPRPENVTHLLETLVQACPAFAQAEVRETWVGYRPRPVGRSAPILGFWPGSDRLLVATGHYRNGLLLAWITAEIIGDLIVHGHSDRPWQSFAP
ncbi:MAG TPA: FAD-dependent oxidoreductase [Cyanobacteria bacterium UBA8156]|nr:FAD-dependent oxidoreductase [Cyanobacteria bacterium UBA8156]